MDPVYAPEESSFETTFSFQWCLLQQSTTVIYWHHLEDQNTGGALLKDPSMGAAMQEGLSMAA